MVEAKVVLLGATSVGKTCIVTRAISDLFDNDQIPTIGASFSTKKIDVDGTEVTLRIWDTAGQERFRSLTPMFYQGSQAALIVFSLIAPDTLDEVVGWIDSLREYTNPMPNLYIVGNKLDLVGEHNEITEKAEEIADKYRAKFFETSARAGNGIADLFADVAASIRNKVESSQVEQIIVVSDNQNKKSCC